MPNMFTDYATGARHLAIASTVDWTVDTAVLPNGDNAVHGDGSIAETSNICGAIYDFHNTDHTVEFWIKMTAGTASTIVSCGILSGQIRWTVTVDASRIVAFNLYNQAGGFWTNRVAGTALSLSIWHYIVLQTQNGTPAPPNLYLDEVLSNGSSTAINGFKPTPVATDRIFLGTSPSLTQSCPTTTEVAHLAIYDRLITVPEQHDHNLAMIAA